LLVAVYVVAGRLGLMMDATSGLATLVWAPTGIALAALLRFGVGLWPGVLLGAFIVNVLTGARIPVACGIAIGNTLEAVAGTWFLNRVVGFHTELDRSRDVIGLIMAALGATILSATCGVLSMRAGGSIAADHMLATWRPWWIGDLIGAMVVAPVLLVPWRVPRSWLEPVALVITIGAVCMLVFGPLEVRWLHHTQWLTPVLIWAALRFGTQGAAGASIVTSAIAVWGTARGYGSFGQGPLHDRLEVLQGFIGVQAATFLLLGAVAMQVRAASELADRALRVREEFLSVASHELRTPATALQLSLQAIERKVASGAPIDRPVKTALRQTERLARLIEDLLDVSRIQAGKLTLSPEPVDLLPMARRIVEDMGAEIDGAECKVSLSGDESLRGQWDRARLEQVVINLLSNAIKYGAKGPIELTVERAGAKARLTVCDHGIGIEPDMQVRIFEPFERAASSSDYGGLGLGLFIVRRIVEQHGGAVRVESKPGEGARFVVELPISAA
jgi:signal transduction histidine kinase